jgi:type I restriction enzyme S subunit
MKAYPAYKEIGIEWLGKIPAHFSLTRLGYESDVIDPQPDHRAPAIDENGLPYIGIRDVNQDGTVNIKTARKIVEAAVIKQEQSFTIDDGDIVFCKVGTLGLPRHIMKPDVRFGLSATLVLIKVYRKNDNRFIKYALESNHVNNQINLEATGSTRQALGIQIIRRFSLVTTSLSEQQSIADFLDRKTAQIDDLIAKKQRQIDLLHEQRTALINQAVTGKLDLTGFWKPVRSGRPMKDSGVEWLGEIPSHWKLPQIRYVAKVVRGQTPRPAGAPRFFDGDFIPWITVGEVTKDLGMYLTNTKSMLTEEGSQNSIVFDKGTLILTNSGATLGVPKILGITGCMNDGIAAFMQIRDDMSKKFIYFFFTSMTKFLREQSTGSGQPNLNTTIISDIYIPKPPLEEQKAIANYLIEQEDNFKKTSEKLERTIELMKEYRTALISAAVTGKINVREEGAVHE